MRLLIVGMAHSIHVANWIKHIADEGWEIHLYPSMDTGVIHPEVRNITIHHTYYAPPLQGEQIRRKGVFLATPPALEPAAQFAGKVLRYPLKYWWKSYHSKRLANLIQDLQPDIIHSIELQHGGYLTLAAHDLLAANGSAFPTWIVTNWGSDIYYFHHIETHRKQIERILQLSDFYDCECQRDIQIARSMGFKGMAWEPFLNAGGFDIEQLQRLQEPIPPSQRNIILVKGYEGTFGRSLKALEAIALCRDRIRQKQMKICIYSTTEPVVKAAQKLAKDYDLSIEIIPKVSHEKMLRLQGQARIFIGNSISDGVSTSAIEAMAMGAFPIQSYTACIDEWIEDGKSGMITQPEQPQNIARAIERALIDDEMVDRAAGINQETIRRRANRINLKEQVLALYRAAHQHQIDTH
jgi:glycosyltransferase involved in cell wall biosynthesis